LRDASYSYNHNKSERLKTAKLLAMSESLRPQLTLKKILYTGGAELAEVDDLGIELPQTFQADGPILPHHLSSFFPKT
jgi:hypothetical protein